MQSKTTLLRATQDSSTTVVLKQAATSLRLLAFQVKQLYEIEQRAKARADTTLSPK